MGSRPTVSILKMKHVHVESGIDLRYLVVMSSHALGTSKNNLKIMWPSITGMIQILHYLITYWFVLYGSLIRFIIVSGSQLLRKPAQILYFQQMDHNCGL